MADPDGANVTYIVEDRVHDQLTIFGEALRQLRHVQAEERRSRETFYRLGAILFGEETKIPLVTERDVLFVRLWGPRFAWTGVPFYPVPNNLDVIAMLPEKEIIDLCANDELILWNQGQGVDQADVIRAHARLQVFADAWMPYLNATEDVDYPRAVYENAAAALVKATIIPVGNLNQLHLTRALRRDFAWYGNAKYLSSPNLRSYYGTMTLAEAREDEQRLSRSARNMRFRTFVHP